MADARVDPRSIPEIREAIGLFEAWERSVNDIASAKRFTEAVELLDDYLECEPRTPHKEFIQNLRISHARSLLQHLAQVDRKDFYIWLEYALAVLVIVRNEAEVVMASRPELKVDFDAFLAVWKDVLADALRRANDGA